MINTQLVSDAVKSELGSFFSTDAHADVSVTRYINSSVRDICINKNFSFNKYITTVTVTAGTTNYSIPYQIETLGLLDSEGKEVTYKNFENYYLTTDKSNIVGIWDDVLVSSKVGTFTLLYRGFPSTITTLTGTINIPEHFYDAIVIGAIRYGYLDEKDYPTANEKFNIFKGLIGDLATRNSNAYPMETIRFGEGHVI